MRTFLRPRLRATASLAAATLLLTSCGVADTVVGAVGNAASEAIDAVTEAASEIGNGSSGNSSGSDSGQGSGGSSGPGEGTTTPGEPGDVDSGDAGSASLGAPIDDFASVGFHGPAMVRSSVANMIVEIDVQEGVSINENAVNAMVDRMRQITAKPGGVTRAGGNTFASDRTQWTSADLRAAAASNRNNFSNANTVVVYMLYVDGGFISNGEETNAIGVAYNASEAAIFGNKVAAQGGLLGSSSDVEKAVLVHEWGHLLGLVNIGYDSEIDHEDPDHPGHSRSKSSVMYFAIESTLISTLFNGPPPSTFDDADLADIEGLRSGKYRG